MTIGDVLAVIAGVLTVGAAWAATLLIVALAFPARVALAQARLTASPGVCLLLGAGTVLVGGLLAALFWGAAAGGHRLVAGLILGILGAVAAVGSAAISRLLSERIDGMGSPMTPFSSLTRTSVLFVAAGFLPVIGWFFITPCALLLAVGSGIAGIWAGRHRKQPHQSALTPEPRVMETAA